MTDMPLLPPRPLGPPRLPAGSHDTAGWPSHADRLSALALEYAAARNDLQEQLIAHEVTRIVRLGTEASTKLESLLELQHLGNGFPALVLRGTLQQQFACRLARRLTAPPGALPKPVVDFVLDQLAKALIKVLKLGAPTTRDSAVEGLGALLKLLGDPATRFALPERLDVLREPHEEPEAFDKREEINRHYFDRLERRHLMVLTIAGDTFARDAFCSRLQESITSVIERLCDGDVIAWEPIDDVLFSHADLLRILPAIARQKTQIPVDAPELLEDAARVRAPARATREQTITAFARFQESVFRTIDAAITRSDWTWIDLDAVVAEALFDLPRSIAGTARVCNAQIRATIAVIRTAITLVTTWPVAPRTKAALKPLFANLDERIPWANPGIFEGCYRGIFELAAQSRHDDLTDPALGTLIKQLSRRPGDGDLAEIHRHIVISSSFRRIVATAMDAGDQVHQDIESSVRELLRNPTAPGIQKICRKSTAAGQTTRDTMLADLAPSVVSAIAFEGELLARSASMFEHWSTQPTLRKVLLTRILAAELRTLSRDAQDQERHPLLKRVFTGIESVALTDESAMHLAWSVLSSLPADAAETADAEIQRFAEYRGKGSQDVDDLPGYVLAMISTTASGHIAAAIAREIDLNLQAGCADFGRLLYHVTLRGPHQSIFDHLLPRVRDKEQRDIVLLFRRHVARVLASRKDEHDSELDLPQILEHVRQLSGELEDPHGSETLRKLHVILGYFINLTQRSNPHLKDEERDKVRERVWHHLTDNKTLALFLGLDQLAAEEFHRRTDLAAYKRHLTELRDKVSDYLALPIDNFGERKKTLAKLIDLTERLETALRNHKGLQPPERTLLVALLRHLRTLFDDTMRWSCEEAHRLRERGDKERFWLFFCDADSEKIRVNKVPKLVKTKGAILHTNEQIQHTTEQIEAAPPRYPTERAKFEKYFVHWMTSDLDVQSLKSKLENRWSFFFQTIYLVTTNFWLTSATVLFPFGIAAVLDLLGWHEWEGVGFFVVTSTMILAAFLALTDLVYRVTPKLWFVFAAILLPFGIVIGWSGWNGDSFFVTSVVILTMFFALAGVIHRLAIAWRGTKEALPQYWLECLLPRLLRLTAVPMALIVEFDHSYEFPQHASTWALLLLIGISYLTTRFFVTREMVDRQENPDEGGITPEELTPEDRQRVRQIVAVALAHSFGIAVLLSAIFSSSHHWKENDKEETEASVHVVMGAPSKIWSIPEAILARFDQVSEEHPEPRFLGFFPRVVALNFGKIAEHFDYPLPAKVAEHATFRFYPTIILSWTALGLFFGIFLEGFMKGERLRGGPSREGSETAES